MKKETCDCVTKVEAKLVDFTGDEQAQLICPISFNTLARKPGMEYTYREKKKDGSYKTNKKSCIMIPTYCPFCGIKYEE